MSQRARRRSWIELAVHLSSHGNGRGSSHRAEGRLAPEGPPSGAPWPKLPTKPECRLISIDTVQTPHKSRIERQWRVTSDE
jgi:hypothetical protein